MRFLLMRKIIKNNQSVNPGKTEYMCCTKNENKIGGLDEMKMNRMKKGQYQSSHMEREWPMGNEYMLGGRIDNQSIDVLGT